MIINITKAKQTIGPQKFEGEYSPDANILNRKDASFNGPVKVKGTYVYGADEVKFDGSIGFSLKTLCDRCGKEAEQNFDLKFQERFVKESLNPEIYSFDNDVLDLSLAVSEFIMISLPLQIICNKKCKGLCEGCGQDLNLSKCKCKKESSSAFLILQDLKQDKKDKK